VTFFDSTSFPAATGLAVFSDFDGTIAHPDTLNFLTETFSSLEFRQGIGRKIATGELSLRDGIQQEVATIRGSLEEVLLFLKKHVEIDSAFAAFADWCFEQQIPLTILSAGIKEVIEDLLRPCQLKQVKILANPLRIIDGRWSLQFLDETPWGHDKASAVRQAKADGFYVVYLGDGLSDRGAARSADRVFAKGGLARYCAEEHIRYTELIDFSLVKKKLMHFLQEKGRKH
jgi:2,3-diketo-5-methylthio-1-phosphopentane phosphatase